VSVQIRLEYQKAYSIDTQVNDFEEVRILDVGRCVPLSDGQQELSEDL
jgi:hypothetical protein